MGRTKRTARKNTGGRKPLKTKVRTQTGEVEFIKVVTPPKPAEAEPPICIDITGEDEQEVAGKVRGMLRDIRDEPSAFAAAHSLFCSFKTAKKVSSAGFSLRRPCSQKTSCFGSSGQPISPR